MLSSCNCLFINLFVLPAASAILFYDVVSTVVLQSLVDNLSFIFVSRKFLIEAPIFSPELYSFIPYVSMLIEIFSFQTSLMCRKYFKI